MNDAGLWASFIMYSSQPQSFTLFSFHPVEENSQHWFLTMSYFLENHMQQMLNAPVCSCRKLMTNTALFCGKSTHMAQKGSNKSRNETAFCPDLTACRISLYLSFFTTCRASAKFYFSISSKAVFKLQTIYLLKSLHIAFVSALICAITVFSILKSQNNCYTTQSCSP